MYYSVEVASVNQQLRISVDPINKNSDPDLYVSLNAEHPLANKETYNWKSTLIGLSSFLPFCLVWFLFFLSVCSALLRFTVLITADFLGRDMVDVMPGDKAYVPGKYVIGVYGYAEHYKTAFRLMVEQIDPSFVFALD